MASSTLTFPADSSVRKSVAKKKRRRNRRHSSPPDKINRFWDSDGGIRLNGACLPKQPRQIVRSWEL